MIFLNLVRNVIYVLDVLLREMSLSDRERGSTSSMSEYVSDSDLEPSSHVYRFSDKHRLLKLRLAPLRRVLADLEKRIGPGSHEVYTTNPTPQARQDPKLESRSREFGIISRDGWRSAFEKLRLTRGDDGSGPVSKRREEENYETADILVGCREDMKTLWEDAVVQQILTDRQAAIEDSPGL